MFQQLNYYSAGGWHDYIGQVIEGQIELRSMHSAKTSELVIKSVIYAVGHLPPFLRLLAVPSPASYFPSSLLIRRSGCFPLSETKWILVWVLIIPVLHTTKIRYWCCLEIESPGTTTIR